MSMTEERDASVRRSPRETECLEAIRQWQILDVPPDRFEREDRRPGRTDFDVPYAVVTVIDAEWMWFRAHHGVAIDGIPRAPGLCNTVVCNGEPLILPDARLDVESLANPLVAGEFGLRFYVTVGAVARPPPRGGCFPRPDSTS